MIAPSSPLFYCFYLIETFMLTKLSEQYYTKGSNPTFGERAENSH